MIQPALNFNFATGTLDPRITFSRGSNATRFDSTGTLVTMTGNQPRFEYDPVTLLPKGLLIEGQRANLLTYSDQFNDVSWTKTGASISTDIIVAPNGTTSGDKLVENAVTSTHVVGKTISGLSGATGSFSVFLKAGERIFALLGSTLGHIAVNLATGQIINSFGSPINTQSVNVGNGWWRVGFSGTPAITDGNNIFVYTSQDGVFANRSYAGDGTSGIYVWGAQLEAGAFPTSYIPTTSAAVTRNADVATIAGTAFSGFWRSGPGSILVRALPSTVSGTRPLVQVDDATADNIIALRGNTTNPELYIRAGGSDQATIDAGTISAAAYRLAGAWQAGSAAAALNSGLAVNGAPGSIPAVTQMRLGSDGTNYLNGHLQSLEYYDERILNAALRILSGSVGRRSLLNPIINRII